MRVLITGASGFIGSQLSVRLARNHEVLGVFRQSRKPLPFPAQGADLTDERSVADLVRNFRPDVIVHSAALSRVLVCERSPVEARTINVETTGRLARWAERVHAKLIFMSSDQVFSGGKGAYIESDSPDPINCYGRTKLEAERLVLESSSGNLILRSNSVVGPSGGRGESFTDWVLSKLRTGERISLFPDQYRSPIHVRALLDVLEESCVRNLAGLMHVGGPQRMSRTDLGFAVARAYGLSAEPIDVTNLESHPESAIMPKDTSYNISRLRQMMPHIVFRPLEEEFLRDAREVEVAA